MKKALIGYTGFVGSNINSQAEFSHLYNSKNISEIRGQSFDLLVCAGVRAEKWKANQNPEEDLKSIEELIGNLKEVRTEKLVLVSTIDVYPKPVLVNENSEIDSDKNSAYGRNRFYLEQFVAQHFAETTVVRLPGLFGQGIKKNLIFDIIHDNQLELFHSDSNFQFYNLDYIWKDVVIALENNLSLINFATEPTSVAEVFEFGLGKKFTNESKNLPANYDMKTIHEKLYQGKNGYIYGKEQILKEIESFITSEKE